MEFTRVFVVGCSRSGTTIVQSMIAREFGLWTLPETRFFNRHIHTFYGRVSAFNGLYQAIHNLRRGNRLADAFATMRYLRRSMGWRETICATWSTPRAARAYQNLLDHEAGKAGARGWLEKTPKHFRELARIRALVPGARFVFVVRHGEDVAASLRDRYNRNPEDFAGEGDVHYAIDLWNESMLCLLENLHQPDVMVLCYESWIADPDHESATLATFLGLSRGNPGTHGKNHNVARKHEVWKQYPLEKIVEPESKFSTMFSDSEIAVIRSRLRLDLYHLICSERKAEIKA